MMHLVDILSLSDQGCSPQGKVKIAVGKYSVTESSLKLQMIQSDKALGYLILDLHLTKLFIFFVTGTLMKEKYNEKWGNMWRWYPVFTGVFVSW